MHDTAKGNPHLSELYSILLAARSATLHRADPSVKSWTGHSSSVRASASGAPRLSWVAAEVDWSVDECAIAGNVRERNFLFSTS